jgi:hypothetical protein
MVLGARPYMQSHRTLGQYFNDSVVVLLLVCRHAAATLLMCGCRCCAASCVMRLVARHCSSAALQLQQLQLSSCWRSLQPH